MHKAKEVALGLALTVIFTLLALAAWEMSEVYMEVPAPITPLMWLCSAFFWFCTIAYGGSTVFALFRRKA